VNVQIIKLVLNIEITCIDNHVSIK